MAGVVVLGGGVTGGAFVAALRRLDEDVPITLVERELVGGECSYWACIPSKTMLRPLEVAQRARVTPGAAEVLAGPIDPAPIFAWRDEVAAKDDTSQAEWLADLGVELVRGRGEIVEPGRVRVADRELEYDRLLIATGSLPTAPPIAGLEDVPTWTSREATTATSVPESLVVVGGGAVGCELAQFYARMGAHVTVVQNGDRLLARVEPEAGELLADAFREEGVDVRLGARAQRVEVGNGSLVSLHLEGGEAVEGQELLVATGRRPNVEGFGLERLDLRISRGGIDVDERLRAGENVWAAGDVTGVALFTHVGKYQARVAAAGVAGREARADYRAIPAAIFTDPQIATVGDVSGEGTVVSRHGIDAVSRASTYARPKRPGYVKLFADPKRRVLVGAAVVGPEAGELLGQLTLAVRAEVPVDVLRDTIQPFPTFSEAIFFAARALDLDGWDGSA
ncbi:MAG: NAD(P)/FAD-dependent oxidoreductase [Actinobacteria bacterium]|nr:MAG: NAD(P)/FAD-dependent oxidoreductase [Actinomycetota bacterium]